MAVAEKLNKYDEIYKILEKDEDLMLKVLVRQFGVSGIWDIIHTHVTSLHDARDLDDDELGQLVDDVVDSYESVISETLEAELELKGN